MHRHISLGLFLVSLLQFYYQARLKAIAVHTIYDNLYTWLFLTGIVFIFTTFFDIYGWNDDIVSMS